jgi:hypothetical protein
MNAASNLAVIWDMDGFTGHLERRGRRHGGI